MRLLLFFSVVFFIIGLAHADGQVSLQWDPNNPNPDGYRMFMRLDGHSYDFSSPVWEGTSQTCTINTVPDGATVHFVVRAFVGSVESGDSNEVTWTAPATGTRAVPSNIRFTQ